MNARPGRRRLGLCLGALATVAGLQLAVYEPSEPFFNNDETRHVMTGVFFRDFVLSGELADPRGYATSYYLQYPALGLLVWPPAFHAMEGLWMVAAGTSLPAAKLLVGLLAALAGAYLFRWVAAIRGDLVAAGCVLLFGLAPLVFVHSRHVMLEVPTLAWSVVAMYHFWRYVEAQQRRDVVIAALAAALAALTRLDGLYLPLAFALLLFARRRLDLLRRREIWLAALVASALLLPVYAVMMRETGGAQVQALVEGTEAESTGFLAAENFLFYPLDLPLQIGWFALPLALIGLAASWRRLREPDIAPFAVTILATYLMVVVAAEPKGRHVIYWVPAFAFFAMEGLRSVGNWRGGARAAAVGGALVIAGTAWLAVREPVWYVRGYADAARYVVAETRESPRCLFDSFLNGDFIYQMRRHDTGGRITVLRGDKLLYTVASDPHAGYQERAHGKGEILDLIYLYDPEFIVVEDPQVYFRMPLPDLLRQTLAENGDRFRLERVVPVESNYPSFRGVKLLIYRNILRNPRPEQDLGREMQTLGGSVGAAG